MLLYLRLSQVWLSVKVVQITKPAEGHAAKADTTPKRFMKEIRDVNLADYTVGQEVKVDTFAVGEKIDVTGISKDTTTGDTLCDEKNLVILESMNFPEPVIHLSVEPKSNWGCRTSRCTINRRFN